MHLAEVRSLFAITSRCFHPVLRPENINNLYPVVTSRRESKRANTYRDWSHLALRKPATSRAIAGSYGGDRFSRVMVPPSPARAPPAVPTIIAPLSPPTQERQFLERDYASSSGGWVKRLNNYSHVMHSTCSI